MTRREIIDGFLSEYNARWNEGWTTSINEGRIEIARVDGRHITSVDGHFLRQLLAVLEQNNIGCCVGSFSSGLSISTSVL